MEQSIEHTSIKENLKNLLTPAYYKQQLSGWMTRSYILLAFGMGALITLYLSMGDYSFLTTIQTIGGMIGFLCVNAITNNKPVNGLLGLLSALMIIYAAWHATAYGDILMQTAYILVLDIPIILFGSQWQNKTIHSASKKEIMLIIAWFLVMFGTIYFMDTQIWLSKSPFFDALGASIGLTGALAMMLKTNFQTFWWFSQGILSITLWAHLMILGATSPVLFVVYMLYLLNNVVSAFSKNSPWHWKFLDKLPIYKK